ncbi:potassium channel family protein [Thiomonas sp.]
MKTRTSWIGFNRVPAGERRAARALGRFAAPWMIGIALLAMPSFYLEDLQGNALYAGWGLRIDALIFAAFAAETALTAALCRRRWRYLAANWLKVFIVLVSGLALLGANRGWMPIVHLLHLLYIALVFAWLLGHVRRVFSDSVIPYAMLLGAGAVLLAGVGFYRIEPTIRTYGQGVWLAFTTAATVGYGDFVPTTAASRALAVLVVIGGYAVFSLVTAGIAAFFVGEGEKKAQCDIQDELRLLREEVRNLRRDLAASRSHPCEEAPAASGNS